MRAAPASQPDADGFAVRFHYRSVNLPTNPFHFAGAGRLRIEADFVEIDGRVQRSFRPARPSTERLRRIDICNVWTDGEVVIFDVEDVGAMRTVGFSVASADVAQAIVAALPARQTEAYVIEQAERALFQARLSAQGRSTPVMWTLVGLNVLVFVLMQLTGAFGGPPPQVALHLVQWGSNAGPYTLHGQWWRLLTSMFLHGGWLHILFNMLALVQIGALVERMFGRARFLLLYLIAGLCGGLASVLWNAHVNSVGASGAIFGVIGGLLAFILKPDSGVPLSVMRELKSIALGFVVYNIAAGFLLPHTDNAAHLGGLLGGLLAGYVLARSLRGKELQVSSS